MEDKKQNSIKTYVSAWNEPDEDKIRHRLEACVISDVHYCDPFTDIITGIEELAGVMAGVSPTFPGVIHALSGEPAGHHTFGYYNWVARLSNGKEIPGVDYIEFAPDGRIAQVVSFTDPADWQE